MSVFSVIQSDSLPTARKLKDAKPRITDWWQQAWTNDNTQSTRFFAEANIALPGLTMNNTSTDDLFEALEMVRGFGLAVPPRSINPPSLTSNHIAGKAIDMTITWTGTINVKKKDGNEEALTFSTNANTNIALHKVGESFGVKKLKTDAPHWSFNGR